MKHKILLLFYFIILPGGILAQNGKESVRFSQLFNFGWKFQSGKAKDASSVNYDDSGWRTLDLPHDFQIEQPWDRTASSWRGFKAMGECWYRKSFKSEASWKGKKVLLDFEGLMTYGEVWFNGKKMVDIDYGYLGDEADITPYIDYENENVVAVYASTGKNDGQRWYTGGGLFRDVYLVVKDTISIARHGIFITTPHVSEQKADINVQVEVEGLTDKGQVVEINTRIYSPQGELVAEIQTSTPHRVRLQSIEVALPEVTVAIPQLWSCETPHLYTAEVSLTHNGKVIDNVTETFGIRTVEFSPEFGLRLNGKKVFLKGVANHHDLGALGAAVYDKAIERMFKQLKAFGFNHIRTSHNPYSESFMKLADKYGILIVDEFCDKWCQGRYWPGKVSFYESWYKQIPEWIKRDRNHPSVILWSLGNELQMREDLAGFPTGDWGVTTYKMLDVLVKRYDSTRKTTVAMFPSRADAVTRHDADFNSYVMPPELSLITEVASYNYQYPAYTEYLKQAPNLIVYQSEASTSELLKAFYGMDYDKMVGLAYWGGIEYWGESNGWPKKGWNYSFFNHALEPYPQAYLIKSTFSNAPVVYIGVVDSEMEKLEWNDVIVGRIPLSSHWNRKEGSKQNLFTYTNAEEVELFVNEKSMGIQRNVIDKNEKRNMIYWQNIPYDKGGDVIAIARNNGREVSRHRLETTGKPKSLKMVIENADWKADGMDLQYVKVYAVDGKGRVVPTAEGEITFDVSGPSKIVAVDNGDHMTDELFTGNKIKLHNGFAMVLLRSGQIPGEVVIKAFANNLKSTSKRLSIKSL